VAKRDVETATIAVAAFNEDVKEEDLEEDRMLFCSSPFVFNKSACVSDDDRGGDMIYICVLHARKSTQFLPRLFERKNSSLGNLMLKP